MKVEMESEKLTRELIESHLFSAIEVSSKEFEGGAVRWAWCLSRVGRTPPNDDLNDDEDQYRFSSREAAIRFAFGWVARNRPDLERAAVAEAREGLAYRRSVQNKLSRGV